MPAVPSDSQTMSQNTFQNRPEPKRSHAVAPFEHFLYAAALLAGLAMAYFSTLQWMVQRYLGPDSYYSHGFIVPLVSGYFIWKDRHQLGRIGVESNWIGAILIVVAMLVHILAAALYVFSLSGFSLYLFVIGSVLFLFGRHALAKLFFPLAFLVFMFPVPEAFLTAISLPLKMLVAKTAVFITGLAGMPVFREGFQITIPAGKMLVGNPCSGLRSIIAFLAIASILVHLRPLSKAKSALLFVSAIPIAMSANVLRVLFLISISHVWGLAAARPESFWHGASGIGTFIIGLLLLFLTGNALDAQKNKN